MSCSCCVERRQFLGQGNTLAWDQKGFSSHCNRGQRSTCCQGSKFQFAGNDGTMLSYTFAKRLDYSTFSFILAGDSFAWAAQNSAVVYFSFSFAVSLSGFAGLLKAGQVELGRKELVVDVVGRTVAHCRFQAVDAGGTRGKPSWASLGCSSVLVKRIEPSKVRAFTIH